MAAVLSALRSVRSDGGLRSREQVGHSETIGTVTKVRSVDRVGATAPAADLYRFAGDSISGAA